MSQKKLSGELFLIFIEVMKDIRCVGLMADWIQDNRMDHPEATRYVKWLQCPYKIRLSTLTEAVAKFGDVHSRRLMRKLKRRSVRGNRTQRYTGADRNRAKKYSLLSIKEGPLVKQLYVKTVGSYG